MQTKRFCATSRVAFVSCRPHLESDPRYPLPMDRDSGRVSQWSWWTPRGGITIFRKLQGELSVRRALVVCSSDVFIFGIGLSVRSTFAFSICGRGNWVCSSFVCSLMIHIGMDRKISRNGSVLRNSVSHDRLCRNETLLVIFHHNRLSSKHWFITNETLALFCEVVELQMNRYSQKPSRFRFIPEVTRWLI